MASDKHQNIFCVMCVECVVFVHYTMDKLLQTEYKKLDHVACTTLMNNLGGRLPKELVRLILSYLLQYARHTFSRLNLRVRYWQHIGVALCYSASTVYIRSFEEVDEMYVREILINSYVGGHVLNDSIIAHKLFRKHVFEWHGKTLRSTDLVKNVFY